MLRTSVFRFLEVETLVKRLYRIAFLFLIVVAFFRQNLSAQEQLNDLYLQAYEHIRSNRPDEALPLLDRVMEMNSLLENVYAMYAFAHQLKGDLHKATTYLREVEDMGETSFYPAITLANQRLLEGEMAEAKSLVKKALQYQTMAEDIQDLLDAWDAFINAEIEAEAFSQMKTWFTSVEKPNNNFALTTENYGKAIEQAQQGKSAEAISTFNKVVNDLNALSPKGINTIYKWQAEVGASLFYNGFIEAGGQLLNNTYLNTIDNNAVGKNVKTLAGYYYIEYLKYTGNLETGIQVSKKVLPYSERLMVQYLTSSLLLSQAQMYNSLGDRPNTTNTCYTLLRLARSMNNSYMEAQALNTMGAGFTVSTDPEDRAQAKKFLEDAQRIALRDGYTNILESVQSNLAITYWQSGQREKAVSTYQSLIDNYLESNREQQAIINLNNVGSMYFFTEDYAKAIPYFEKAIDITEQFREQLSTQNRVSYLQTQLSAYEFLTYCYARTGNGEGMFNAIEKQRARVLTDRLKMKGNTSKTSLQRFQSKLKADEVALFYSLTEPGAVAVNVVTKDASYAVLNEFFTEFVALKQKYIDKQRVADMQRTGFKLPANGRVSGDRILVEQDIANMFNQEDFETLGEITRELLQSTKPEHDQMRAEFLDFYYKFLIAPISTKIVGKKKLIISPDGLLNFIPFEALMNSSGNYLIENYGVRYIQSASVANIIESRNYSANRKPMLAMGGAIYEEMSEKADAVRSVERMQEMNFRAVENAAKGLSQREVYAALGFGKMTYLEGTLNEVKLMAETVAGADVYTGTEMNETFLKQLNNEGKLANYKVVHLATHGFALPDIPELSGVAMSIFAEERNNQDGYLISSEIAALNLNADLVVLSACETGLGKIYGGEGVMGLTQSLILAGANGAAVSLWAVNDASTMMFMAGMYELKSKTNWSYADAMDDMKRRFIRGEFGAAFQGTNYWAPFIHYGN
ncbi:CHAT domain-containing protein [Roseivirga pacifica]|uniref:CHAT domain-containing protein n=1 Tax=Roseivirga pacifica TaxID=1267423 RepID=UPI00227C94DD|nr:CHAT domain-containing protein [Roseivirga pacifica]